MGSVCACSLIRASHVVVEVVVPARQALVLVVRRARVRLVPVVAVVALRAPLVVRLVGAPANPPVLRLRLARAWSCDGRCSFRLPRLCPTPALRLPGRSTQCRPPPSNTVHALAGGSPARHLV